MLCIAAIAGLCAAKLSRQTEPPNRAAQRLMACACATGQLHGLECHQRPPAHSRCAHTSSGPKLFRFGAHLNATVFHPTRSVDSRLSKRPVNRRWHLLAGKFANSRMSRMRLLNEPTERTYRMPLPNSLCYSDPVIVGRFPSCSVASQSNLFPLLDSPATMAEWKSVFKC